MTPQVAAAATIVGHQMVVSSKKLDAYAALFGGLGSAASLLLFAAGQERAGYAFGLATTVGSAVLAFVRILGEEETA